MLPYRKRGQDVKLENVVGICSYGNDGVWLGGMNEVALFCKGKEIRRIDLTPYLTRAYAQVAALLCDGDIYILDEALSHLSFERKEIIIQTLFETYQEKLFVVISHDKKIMNMGYDYVIMEKGKIIEKG